MTSCYGIYMIGWYIVCKLTYIVNAATNRKQYQVKSINEKMSVMDCVWKTHSNIMQTVQLVVWYCVCFNTVTCWTSAELAEHIQTIIILNWYPYVDTNDSKKFHALPQVRTTLHLIHSQLFNLDLSMHVPIWHDEVYHIMSIHHSL